MKTSLVILGALLHMACKAPDETRPSPSLGVTKVSSADPAAGDERERARRVITDEKLKSLAVFRKEMQVQMSLLIQRSLPASMADGVDGGKPPGKWPSRDELLRQAREVEQDAHTKSGLTPSDSEQLGSLLSPYFKKRTAAVLAGKKLSELREKAETGPLSETDEATRKKLTDQVEQFRTVREEYERKWGKNVLAIVDKHESELLGLMAPGMVMVFPK